MGQTTAIRKVGGKLCFWRSPIPLRRAARLVEERLSFWGTELPLCGGAAIRMVGAWKPWSLGAWEPGKLSFWGSPCCPGCENGGRRSFFSGG